MPVIESNMYVLTHGHDALVVDPSISAEAETLLLESGVQRCTVLLTHEHYDHICGVNRLRELFSCNVVCTEVCAEAIADPRKSGTMFFAALFLERSEEERRTVEALLNTEYRCAADTVFSEELTLEWHGLSVRMKSLPGHSRGSQVIRIIEKYVFTGDSLVPGEQTILRLPGGSRRSFVTTALPYLRSLPWDCIVYPGHGNAAAYMERAIQESLGNEE